jgi:glutamate dehydrogenase
MFVTDDVPFLVDTVRMVLDRYDLGIHLMVHPMLPIARNEANEVIGFFDEADTDQVAEGDATPMVEAWTLIELDRCAPDVEQQLEADVATAIGEVVRVVGDFDEMRERMASVADGDPLLAWLGNQHFVLLGAASYDRTVGADGDPQLEFVPGTELGEYRPDARLDPARPYPPSKAGDEEVVIARTDAVATVHRPSRMTCISVRPRADDGRVEHRFIGLLGSGAYRESVFSIPTVADRANEVLALAGVSEVSHTGRAVKNVVETLPRDIVFELDSQALADVVIDIVGLQERRIVRVFDVAEPVGPWTTVFVYVPRARSPDAARIEFVGAYDDDGSRQRTRRSRTARSGRR